MPLESYLLKEKEINSYSDENKYSSLRSDIDDVFAYGINPGSIKKVIDYNRKIDGYIDLMKMLEFEGFGQILVKKMLDLKMLLSEKFKAIIEYREKSRRLLQDEDDLLLYERFAGKILGNVNMPSDESYQRDIALLKEVKLSVMGYLKRYSSSPNYLEEASALKEKSIALVDTIDLRLKRDYVGISSIKGMIEKAYSSIDGKSKAGIEEMFFCEEQITILQSCLREIDNTLNIGK